MFVLMFLVIVVCSYVLIFLVFRLLTFIASFCACIDILINLVRYF